MNLKILRKRNISLLLAGQLVSLIGSNMQSFALSLYVLYITGSATKFAMVNALSFAVNIILGLFAGVIADWFDRKKIVVGLDFLSAIVTGVFAVLYYINGELSMLHVYILTTLLSAISAFFSPAIASIIPSVAEKDELVAVNSFSSMIRSFGSIISGVLAGFLMGILGIYIILIINSVSFFLSAISEMFIRVPNNEDKTKEKTTVTFINDFKEGVAFVKGKKLLYTIILVALFINFAGAPTFLGLTYFSKQVLGVRDYEVGMINGAFIIATSIAAVLVPYVNKRLTLGKITFYFVMASSFCGLLFSVVTSQFYVGIFDGYLVPFVSILIICMLLGACTTFINIGISSLLQQVTPLEMMGRVSTIFGLCAAFVPIGQVVFGFMYDAISVPLTLLISSALNIIIIMLFRKTLVYSNSSF